MSVLLDTNIVIDHLRGRAAATHFLSGLRRPPSLSVISILEIYAGARNRDEERQIERLLTGSKILDVTADIARVAGQFIKHYERSHGLDDADAVIAATAEHHGLSLATLNVKHFPMLRGLKPAY